MSNWVQSWVKGDLDWRELSTKLRRWAPVAAGALFGAGWWCFIDAIVFSKAILNEKVPFVFWVPGVIATIAMVMINLVSREQLNSDDSSSDEDSDTKQRCWLFVSYLVAFGSVGGAGAVFVKAVTNHDHVGLGVGVLLQAGFVLCSALLFWAFRSPSDTTDYFSY